MKLKTIFAAAIATLISSQAMAAQPNLYMCEGLDSDIRVSYSSSSMTGQPQYNVNIDGENVTPFHDENYLVSMTTDNTRLGLLVTAGVIHKRIADAPSQVYALFVPGITLDRNGHEAQFETKLLIGSNGGFMALPAVHQRINRVETLTCTAQKVFF